MFWDYFSHLIFCSQFFTASKKLFFTLLFPNSLSRIIELDLGVIKVVISVFLKPKIHLIKEFQEFHNKFYSDVLHLMCVLSTMHLLTLLICYLDFENKPTKIQAFFQKINWLESGLIWKTTSLIKFLFLIIYMKFVFWNSRKRT